MQKCEEAEKEAKQQNLYKLTKIERKTVHVKKNFSQKLMEKYQEPAQRK